MTSTPFEPSGNFSVSASEPSTVSTLAEVAAPTLAEGSAVALAEDTAAAPQHVSAQDAKAALERAVKEKTASLAAQAAAGFADPQDSGNANVGAGTAFERALLRKSMSTMFDRPTGQATNRTGTNLKSDSLGHAPSAGTSTTAQSATHAAPAATVPDTHPAISNYTDFRLFLRDVYEYRRAHEGTRVRPYSYSTFSAAADIKSPNYLKLIIEGRRNLSDDMVAKFARALRLHKAEADEFRVLVHYGQASQPIDRNQFLKELADLRARREIASSNVDQQAAWDKVPDWIGWVLYSMVDQADVKFDPESLQKLFRVRANPEHIRASLQKLIDSGDVAVDANTKSAVKPREMMESPQDLPVAMIRKLQAELIYLGIESLFRDSPKDREFGALTMALTHDEFEHVKFELRQLRKRLHKDTSVRRKQSKGERVYQLNVQLFPVTEKSK